MKRKTGLIALLVLLVIIVVPTGIYWGLCQAGVFQITVNQLRQKWATPNSKFIDLLGVNVHYKDEGSGPAIVLIHGSFGNLRTYDGVVNEMKGHYRLIRIDVPPWGLSGNLSDDVAKSGVKFADVVKALLDHLHIAHASIAGVSSGGVEAFRFASKYPEMTDALILANTPSFHVLVPTEPKIATTLYISGVLLNHTPHWAWRVYMEPLFVDQSQVTPAFIDQYYDFNRRIRGNNARALVPYANHQDILDAQLAKVTAPTLLLWSPADPELPPWTMAFIKKRLTHAKEIQEDFVPNVGHYMPLEAPHEFSQETEKFLQGLHLSIHH